MQGQESRECQARRSRPELLRKPKRRGGSGGYVGGGREEREASWMKRARLRRLERVSPMRVEGDADGEGHAEGMIRCQ
jgi:hypothetical protein